MAVDLSKQKELDANIKAFRIGIQLIEFFGKLKKLDGNDNICYRCRQKPVHVWFIVSRKKENMKKQKFRKLKN